MIKASDLTLSEYVTQENHRKTLWTQCILIEKQKEYLKKYLQKSTLNTPERK